MKIHVAIVSDQTLANLIPALMERPDKVYLICSEGMAQRSADKRLAALLKREAIAVEVKHGAPDVGLKRIHEFAFDLVGEIKAAHPGAEIVLNATGGTKLMSMGFVDMFRGEASRIIYTDTAHRRIEILPDGKQRAVEPEPMKDVLDVPEYLAAQGFRFSKAVSDDPAWCEQAAGRKSASKYLGRNALAIQDFIGAINRSANTALGDGDTLVEPVQSLGRVGKRWADALRELVGSGTLQWSEERPEAVAFVNDEAARFLRGGWLEEYAWHIVKDERVFDARMSVAGSWENMKKGSNEFDVLACNGNQLLFIECKTLRYRDGNDNDIAYKVDSLGQDARGLFGQTWLLSAREPSQVLDERARQAGIRVIGPQSLPKLKDIVREWMGTVQ